MFSARKKFEFVEVVDNDFPDESIYYNQPSMFPHRSDKDVSLFRMSAPLPDYTRFPLILLLSVLERVSSDAVLSFTIIIRSAVTAWHKFVRSTK